jgi:hypothetical protein
VTSACGLPIVVRPPRSADQPTTSVIADQTIALDGHYTGQDYPAHLRRARFRDEETGKTLVFLTNQMALLALTICDLYKKPLAGRALLQMDKATPTDQAVLWDIRERGEDTDLDRRIGLRAGRHRQ